MKFVDINRKFTEAVSKNLFDDGVRVKYTVEARGNTYRLR